jgi:hypothetical protein
MKSRCGTPEGYEKHLLRSERPCGRCLVGNTTFSTDEICSLIHAFRRERRNQNLWNTYQISLEIYQRILTEQGNRCACCLTTDPGQSWNVDHDHETGEVRGILCTGCNTGIGQLGDNLIGVQRAVAYLQAHHDRGGYPKDPKPPMAPTVNVPISAIMQRCFELFSQGASMASVVIIMRLEPDVVNDIHILWEDQGGTVRPVNRHRFLIPKELPTRISCACGFEVLYSDLASSQNAVEQVKSHIEKADPALDAQAELKTLEAEAHMKAFAAKEADLKEERLRKWRDTLATSQSSLDVERPKANKRKRKASRSSTKRLPESESVLFRGLPELPPLPPLPALRRLSVGRKKSKT